MSCKGSYCLNIAENDYEENIAHECVWNKVLTSQRRNNEQSITY